MSLLCFENKFPILIDPFPASINKLRYFFQKGRLFLAAWLSLLLPGFLDPPWWITCSFCLGHWKCTPLTEKHQKVTGGKMKWSLCETGLTAELYGDRGHLNAFAKNERGHFCKIFENPLRSLIPWKGSIFFPHQVITFLAWCFLPEISSSVRIYVFKTPPHSSS